MYFEDWDIVSYRHAVLVAALRRADAALGLTQARTTGPTHATIGTSGAERTVPPPPQRRSNSPLASESPADDDGSVVIDVTIPGTGTKKSSVASLEMREGEEPGEVARRFAKLHGLTAKQALTLEETLRRASTGAT